MYHALLTLHVTGVCLVVGTLFVQSLAVIFRLRLTDPAQIEGAQWIQRRIYLFIYYPILVITIISGLYLALTQGLFSICLLYTSPSPRDSALSRMPSSA